MRKTTLFLLMICTLLLLTSCTSEKISETVLKEPESSLKIEESAEDIPETFIETETETTIETEMETEEETDAIVETEDNSYVIRIERANFPIYDGPSYDNFQVGTVGAAGAFTIVDQVQDDEGLHWGKLKSGAGWVDLSLIEQESYAELIVTASWMDKDLLEGKKFYYCDTGDSPFEKAIAFHTNQTLTNVTFFDIFLNEYFEKGVEYYTIDTWEPDTLFVADVYFAGDFSMFGLTFTDSSGTEHNYYASESGRNGSISFIPMEFELIIPE